MKDYDKIDEALRQHFQDCPCNFQTNEEQTKCGLHNEIIKEDIF